LAQAAVSGARFMESQVLQTSCGTPLSAHFKHVAAY